jgi:hypothetical protein
MQPTEPTGDAPDRAEEKKVDVAQNETPVGDGTIHQEPAETPPTETTTIETEAADVSVEVPTEQKPDSE